MVDGSSLGDECGDIIVRKKSCQLSSIQSEERQSVGAIFKPLSKSRRAHLVSLGLPKAKKITVSEL